MAEPWQQWMPHDIDAWQGSANVQALSDLAYRAVHNLILDMWKQEDCALPTDDKELAKRSRVALRWKKCRDEVLGYFADRTEDGKITHRVTQKKWSQARQKYESNNTARSEAGKMGAAKRWHGKPMANAIDDHSKPIAKNGNSTGTETEQKADTRVEQTFDASMVSRGVLMELGLSGQNLGRNIYDVAHSEIEKGKDGIAVMEAMCGAWREWCAARGGGKIAANFSAEKFFGDGMWKDKPGWPWKENRGTSAATVGMSSAPQISEEEAIEIRDRIEAKRKARM